jgi:hypothetical protein
MAYPACHCFETLSQSPDAARESALGYPAPVAPGPRVRERGERPFVGFEEMEAARLAPSLRARLAEPGRGNDGRPANLALHDLELVPLRDRALVDVAGDDQLGAGVHERAEHG